MLQLLALQAAFWVALAQFRARSRESAWRFALALWAGAALAHAGWAVLHVAAVRERPWALADPTVGLCVLFLPLGVLALAPRRSPGLRSEGKCGCRSQGPSRKKAERAGTTLRIG